MKHEIESEFLQKIFNYLGTRPYSEVGQFFKEIETKIKQVVTGDSNVGKDEKTQA